MNPIGSVSQNAVAQAALAAADFGQVSPTVIKEIEAAAARLLSDAAAANLSASGAGQALPDGSPELRSPDLALAYASFVEGGEEAARNLSPAAALTLLMGKLVATVQNTNASNIAAKAQLLKESRAQLQGSFEQATAAEAEAQSVLDNALAAAVEAAEEAQRRLELANEASKRVDQLQSRLDALPSDSPDRPAVEAELATAKLAQATLRASAQVALTASDEANAQVIAAQDALAGVQRETDRLASLALPGLSLPRDYVTSAAKLQELMAQLQLIVGAAAKEELKSKTELAIEQLKAQEAENLRQAKEQAEKVEKAAKLQKILGCVMIVIAALVSIATTLVTVATAGAFASVAAVTILVLTLAGSSLIDKAIQPLMEHVLLPMIEVVAGVLKKVAVKLGADPAEAEKISKYIAMGVVAAAIVGLVVLLMVVSKSPQVAKILDKLMVKVTTMAAAFAPALVQAATKFGTQLTGAMAKAIGQNVAKQAARVQFAASVTQTVAQAASGAGNAAAAGLRLEGAKAAAAVEVGLANSEVLRKGMREAHDEFAKLNEFLQSILVRMSEISAQTSQASAGMLRNLTA